MGEIKKPEKAKLFIALTSNQSFYQIIKELEENLGKIDLKSNIFDFNFTDYYEEEMGRGLKKLFISFRNLIEREALADIKLLTTSLEKKYSSEGRRKYNLDPGYITLANIVLATTKDFSHRIYLRKGIYAEVTLIFRKGRFESLPWTYPDYKTEISDTFFSSARRILLNQLREISFI